MICFGSLRDLRRGGEIQARSVGALNHMAEVLEGLHEQKGLHTAKGPTWKLNSEPLQTSVLMMFKMFPLSERDAPCEFLLSCSTRKHVSCVSRASVGR